MNRFSNTVIGFLNLLTLLASIPIIGAGLWMARTATTCQNFLQTPLLWLGFIVLLVSLAGFIGACFHVAWALWFYLFVMMFLIAGLMGITVFGFIVTGSSAGSGSPGSGSGGGVPVPGHIYKEYRIGDYSAWMQRKIGDEKNWEGIRSCILGSKTCAKVEGWTPLDYLRNNLTPVQSGCCKPPTSCSYGDVTAGMTQDPDCYKWSNSADILCYECDACKAGVMESIRQSWQKLSVLLVVMVVFLIAIYSVGCCAFRNARRAQTDYPYGRNRMTKVRPRWDYHWWRWLHDRREQLY